MQKLFVLLSPLYPMQRCFGVLVFEAVLQPPTCVPVVPLVQQLQGPQAAGVLVPGVCGHERPVAVAQSRRVKRPGRRNARSIHVFTVAHSAWRVAGSRVQAAMESSEIKIY